MGEKGSPVDFLHRKPAKFFWTLLKNPLGRPTTTFDPVRMSAEVIFRDMRFGTEGQAKQANLRTPDLNSCIGNMSNKV